MNVAERFEQLVSPEPNSGCWLWLGYVHCKFGYGRLQFNMRTELAHRWSWIIHRGEIPDGLSVLHKCDNAHCVNPDHLFLGSLADNTADMCAKGRQRGAVGEANRNAKLTADQVAKIRRDGLSIKAICAQYGIKKSMAYYIRSGKHWK